MEWEQETFKRFTPDADDPRKMNDKYISPGGTNECQQLLANYAPGQVKMDASVI